MLRLQDAEEPFHHNTISKKKKIDMDSRTDLKLSDLPLGFYNVFKIECRKSNFGRFILYIEFQNKVSAVISNIILDDVIPVNGIPEGSDTAAVAQLHIIQRKRDHNRHLITNAELIM